MPYDRSDPRSQLASAARPLASNAANVEPQAFELGKLPPTETTAMGSSLWWVRSQAVVLNHIAAAAGDTFAREDQVDEHVVLLLEAGTATLRANGTERVVDGPAVVFVPPGRSEVVATQDMTVVRLFVAATAEDLGERCANRAFYATPDPNVAPFVAWPAPPSGSALRVYPIDEIVRSNERFGRILRCSTFMINWLYPEPGPRDPARLSPHHHDDFEQLSLQVAGDYVHHMRTPWTADKGQWREDVHLQCESPAVVVVPPPAIHTSQGVGAGTHQLIDVFCPPRRDFSERPGWVVNADEYPTPRA